MSYNLPRILNNLTHDVTQVNPETDIRITSLEVKTKNLSPSVVNDTTITGNLDIMPTAEIFNMPLFEGVQDQLVSASEHSYGMRFTITQPISIIRLGVWLFHWRDVTTGRLTINFWKEGDSVTPIATGFIAQIMTYQPTSYLYAPLVTPILLPVGTYRMSTGYKAGMFYNGVLTKPFTWPSEIINIQSAYTTSPNGAYPTNLTTHDISAGGYFWFDLPPCSNINVTTLNNKLITTSSLVCPEIKTLASEIDVKNHINMNSNNLTNVGLINGLAVVQKGGLYAQTSLFAFTGILSETIIRHGGGLSYGVPLIKANCFMGGDTFLIKVSGKITGAIGDTFIFRVRLNMKSSPLTLAIFNVVLDSASTTIWNVECICSLQNVAVTNTMFTDARYSYFNSSGYLKGVAFNGTTSINTTIDNEIEFTYESPKNLAFTVSNTIINKLY